MLTSTQRAKLRSIAQNLSPILHIGKNGVTDNLLHDIDDALEAHELVKLAVLKNSDYTAKAAMDEVCEALGAQPVGAIGGKFVIYRLSGRENVEHIQF